MLVSVVIPARAWDPHLEASLASIARQELPAGVVLETVVGLAGSAPSELPTGVRVVANPSGTIPDALNLAIGTSCGEVVVRVDARCHLAPGHVARILKALEDPGIGCIGGAQLVLDRGVFGSAYAVAFNSPLLGPSPYRYARRSGPIDSAYLGAWRRRDLECLGGFDPRLLRNQDNELADRVRGAGMTVWFDADLVVGYYNARTLTSAMAHHRDFGRWRMIQAGHGQRGLTRTHVTALGGAAGVGAVLAWAARSPRGRRLALGLGTAGYVAAAAGAWWSAGRLRQARRDIEVRGFHPVGVAAAPAVAVLIDAAWVGGLLQGLVRARPFARTGPAGASG